ALWRQEVLLELDRIERGDDGATTLRLSPAPPFRGLRARSDEGGRTAEWAYFEWHERPGQAATEFELFELGRAPGQLRNLLYFEREKYRGLQARFHARLERLAKCRGKSCRE